MMATKRPVKTVVTGKYAELYADFGNVHEGTFKEWWTKDAAGRAYLRSRHCLIALRL